MRGPKGYGRASYIHVHTHYSKSTYPHNPADIEPRMYVMRMSNFAFGARACGGTQRAKSEDCCCSIFHSLMLHIQLALAESKKTFYSQSSHPISSLTRRMIETRIYGFRILAVHSYLRVYLNRQKKKTGGVAGVQQPLPLQNFVCIDREKPRQQRDKERGLYGGDKRWKVENLGESSYP